MLIDTAKIFVKAGDGGSGCNSLHKDKINRIGRPDGGDGGNGADVIFTVNPNVTTLLDFKYNRHFRSDSGKNGSSNNKTGANGKDYVINLPAGVVIKDAVTNLRLCDLTEPYQNIVICEGGKGGHGNSRGRPATEGEKGQERTLLLELKLIADVSIVGFPNAGKSTLIGKISNAKSKIGAYPFTTKEPILGMVRCKDMDFAVADIPGLIEGSHSGKGLGDKFLKHIERTKIIIHLVDMSTALCGRSPAEDYRLLNKELSLYSKELSHKPQIIAANKMDMEGCEENLKVFKAKIHKKIYPISALKGTGLKELLNAVASQMRKN